MQDEKYRDFNSKLLPTVEKRRVIGVRTPLLRSLAAQLCGTLAAEEFLSSLPHYYCEENTLHAFLVEKIKEKDRLFAAVEQFLPYIDNWATCDQLRPNLFAKRPPELAEKALMWISSAHTYTARFGIGVLMSYYLDGDFYRPEYLERVSKIRSEEYYINMMTAWFFATALAKQYKDAVKYIENGKLDAWTHNKAIQKAVESRRLTEAQKAYLKTLKVQANLPKLRLRRL